MFEKKIATILIGMSFSVSFAQQRMGEDIYQQISSIIRKVKNNR